MVDPGTRGTNWKYASHRIQSSFQEATNARMIRWQDRTHNLSKTNRETLLRSNNMNDTYDRRVISGVVLLEGSRRLPCLRSVIPKYVKPNSFTLSSRATHCARESGSAMKAFTVVKFLREAVLQDAVRIQVPGSDRGHTGRCGQLSRAYSLVGGQNDLHFD